MDPPTTREIKTLNEDMIDISESLLDNIHYISTEIVYNRFLRVGINLYDDKTFEQLTDEWHEAYGEAVQSHTRSIGKILKQVFDSELAKLKATPNTSDTLENVCTLQEIDESIRTSPHRRLPDNCDHVVELNDDISRTDEYASSLSVN